MDDITKWAAALCVAAIGCTALQMLAPKKGLGSIFKMITAAFFLCCLAVPLLSMNSILSLNIDSLPREVAAGEIEERVQKQFEEQVASALKVKLEQAFKNYNITLTEIEVNMDTGEDGSIYINEVVLYLDKQSQSEAIAAKQLAEDLLGIDVTIMIAEN